MDWIHEFAIKRRANQSNVFLMETLDPRRIYEMQTLLSKPNGNGSTKKEVPIKELLGKDSKEPRGIVYDIQRGRLLDLSLHSELSDELQSMPVNQVAAFHPVLQWIDNQIHDDTKSKEHPLFVIIKNAIEPHHAQMLTDALEAWSQDNQVYTNRGTIIVFTANKNLFSDPLRRLSWSISITPSEPKERRELLTRLVEGVAPRFQEAEASLLRNDITDEIVNGTQGLTLHDVESATFESILLDTRILLKHYTAYKTRILSEQGLTYITPIRGFESVGGYDYLKQYIQSHVILPTREPARAAKYGKKPPRGIILYGLPGTGKTWIMKSVAKEVGLPMLMMDASTFLRGIVGESESQVRRIFEVIKGLSPVIVFVDEIDALFMKRGGEVVADGGVRRNVLDQMLQVLGEEDRNFLLVGATNRLQDIDPALKRKGRIDEIVLVLPPDRQARRQIFDIHIRMRNMPLSLTEQDYAEIVSKTFLWTGSDIEALVEETATAATIDNTGTVTKKHIDQAFEAVSINSDERQKSMRETINVIQKEEVKNTGFVNRVVQEFKTSESLSEGDRFKSFLEGL